MPTDTWTLNQISNYLRFGFSAWQGSTPGSWGPGTLTYNVSGLTDSAKTLARAAFQVWDEISGLSFTETSGGANIMLDDTQANAFANYQVSGGKITSASVNVQQGWNGETDPGIDSYTFQTFIHEIGHALGLGHGGPYDGPGFSYGANAIYVNDTWQFTVMSYWNQENYDGGSYRFVMTPMMADIFAMATIYGAPTTTRAGDTTYGFNANAGTYQGFALYDFSSYGEAPSFTIFDSGGTDAIDASGYDDDQLIDMLAGTFSDIGGLNNNIAIAYNTVIENATGGSGADSVFGNAAANEIVGNNGIDDLYGGEGNDTIFGDGKSFVIAAGSNPANLGMGSGQINKTTATGNGTLATALVLNGKFSFSADADVQDATSAAHVSVNASGGGQVDYYRLDLNAAATLVVDMDYTNGFDSWLRLLSSTGAELTFSDDGALSDGAGGSSTSFDSFITFTVTAGTYFIEASRFNGGEPFAVGDSYELQVSVMPGIDPVYGDVLSGGDGNDVLVGGSGIDTLNGDDGNDNLRGDAGNDFVNGGSGIKDTFNFVNAKDGVTVVFGAVVGAGTSSGISTGNDTFSGIERIYGSRFGDVVTGGNGREILEGQRGNDVLNGRGHNDKLFGGDDNDTLTDGLGSDLLFGGANDDRIVLVTDNKSDAANGGIGGFDTLDFSNSTKAMMINVKSGRAEGAGLAFDGFSDFEAYVLSDFNDRFIGSAAADHVNGGAGADFLRGNGGDDTLTGAAGIDRFILDNLDGVDTITDYTVADVVLLRGVAFGGLVEEAGFLSRLQFTQSAEATTASHRMIYNQALGTLYYDSDGVNGASQIAIANFAAGTVLDRFEFDVI